MPPTVRSLGPRNTSHVNALRTCVGLTRSVGRATAAARCRVSVPAPAILSAQTKSQGVRVTLDAKAAMVLAPSDQETRMRIGILGTGMVGQTLGTKLASLGHDVVLGSREPDNAKARAWVERTGGTARCGDFAAAASYGDVLFNCTMGTASIEALTRAKAENLVGKVIVDVSNPLDFDNGMPPTLFVSNTDSLAERLQRAFPAARFVKALNTMNANIMVDPMKLANGEHAVFVSANDHDAKEVVRGLLASFGWKHIVDLGDLSTARGTEQLLPLWIRLWGALQTSDFNFAIAR